MSARAVPGQIEPMRTKREKKYFQKARQLKNEERAGQVNTNTEIETDDLEEQQADE